MSQLVVRLAQDAYVLWSDTVDAPVTAVMGRTAMVALLKSEHQATWLEADSLVTTADDSGTSDPSKTLSHVMEHNRAGPGESRLTLDELINAYSD